MLPKKQRLNTQTINANFKEPHQTISGEMLIIHKKKKEFPSLVSFSLLIPKKFISKSVHRHDFKRLFYNFLKNSFPEITKFQSNFDYILIPKKGLKFNYKEDKEKITQLLKKDTELLITLCKN